MRAAETEKLQQPNLVVSVRQPERITLQAWPTLAGVRGWLQHTRQAWWVLTSGGDHAGRYLERAIDAAKARSDEEFESVLETPKCDHLEYLTAEEKLAMEVVVRMPDNLQREVRNVGEMVHLP